MKHTALVISLLAAGVISALPGIANASSHRESPFLTQSPKVDGTDFYMFRSYETGRSNYVTLIANYQGLQEGAGGPNFFLMDPNALYEIHIDNNGDAKEDLTFQFRFKNNLQDLQVPVNGVKVSVPLTNTGGITDPKSPNLNVQESFTLTVVKGDRRTGTATAVTNAGNGSSTFDKPADYIGNKSFPNYDAYAAKHIYAINVPGCSTPGKLFVGQRKDPFVVNLGGTFDLVNIKAPATAFDPQAENKGLDSLATKNVTSLELELPIACLTNGTEPVIGGWTTASLRQARLLNPAPGSDNASASKEGGAWSQVSRLGMPLVNEVVIGLKDKDKFNASKPSGDGQFASYVTNPTLPALLEILFGSAGVKAPTNFPRNDLVTAFLTGVPGINKPANVVASEELRLNTTTAVTPPAMQSRLGVLGNDTAGFPNGRRPGDDVVDIALRVVMGRLCLLNIGCAPADAPAGAIDFTDGAYVDSSAFDNAFPYLKTPVPGANVK
ncbi:hypothetical protein IGB42_03536 [Andreprevotia sp. IGB-42]|uniref:DUF4331 domain-containing protein n=1 Tax=Andreprevotia sp. IGB-42 TaxID=2497473 RepID=UPI001357BAA6|nr:DUF4331 domain-containing protein [Andreprevotia sp. IGB-42]KAF0811994.1 hypothetical protein IGB42_03536 [Andreprevotia sp. IGB-42]